MKKLKILKKNYYKEKGVNRVMNKFVLIHMSDDHFFIENQENKEVIEFKGKYARSEAYYLINSLNKIYY